MDWIQGQRFISIADFSFAPDKRRPDDYDKLVNTFDIKKLKAKNIIYTHTFYVNQLFDIIANDSKDFIIVTHNSDVNIDESLKPPKNVLKWYSQNINVKDSRIESIPIGIENNRWFIKRGEDKRNRMLSIMSYQPKYYKNLVYMNHNVSTNPDKRQEVYDYLEKKPWVTVERGKNGHEFTDYIRNIYNHWFVICPEGNGMDTHRTWETLYMGSIPIEKRNINNQFYSDLPICFVDDWTELTEKFLEDEYVRIVHAKWNMDKLKFTYWKNKIQKGE